ncbi:hypothetical protein ACXR2T_03745 [Leucobacter sp. HY1910]
MGTSRIANVVLIDVATLDSLSDAEVFRRLNWIGGRISLASTAVLFKANRVNNIVNNLFGVADVHRDFGLALDAINEVRVRKWGAVTAAFLVSADGKTAMGVRCWKMADLLSEISALREESA